MTSLLLSNLKIEIRSLLVSSPTGLYEDELARDYALFNSQRSLPYQLFGYSTLTEFLESLTDVLHRSDDGMFHPIVDQSTEHIFKLVQQQRAKKKTIKKPLIARKRAIPSSNTTSQRIQVTVDAKKSQTMVKQMKIICENKVNKDEKSAVKFERIHLTNDLLQSLLRHFQQQQKS
ncbi:unnamed protein product [Adineta ricciae]|uniref:HTH OST-type domain-containing protein n=1 Tax=Adineta ricciae TaxID=249248 RepID=A0A813NUM1_ADIRI|nr:unnamed protein product [Adineta ricciae]CAF1190507.1 unnamed protein product [Adineta ricciae]